MKTLTKPLSLFAVLLLPLLFSKCGPDDDAKTDDLDFIADAEIFVSDANAPSKIVMYSGDGTNPHVFVNSNLDWSQDILFLESDGVFLVSSLNNGTIARFNAETGEFIDNFAVDIAGPTRMKIGADNLLYVLQWAGDGLVLRYNLDGTFVDKFTSVGVQQSIGIDWDSAGNLYVSSYSSGSSGFVRKFSPAGEDLGKFTQGALRGPTNIWFDEKGDLIVLDWQVGFVVRFDQEGNFKDNVITGLSKPEGVAILDDGRILIGNGGTGAVKMYHADFGFIKDIVMAGAGGLKTPNAVYVRKK